MAFTITWRSVNGYSHNIFPTPASLSTIHNESTEPTGGTSSDLELWTPYYYQQSGLIPTQDFSNLEARIIDKTDLLSYLSGTSVSNKKVLLDFKIKDSSYATQAGEEVRFTVMAWADSTNMRVRCARSLYGAHDQLISRTELSSERLIQIGDRTKVIAGNFTRNSMALCGVGFFNLGLNGSQLGGDVFCATQTNFASIFGGSADGEPVSPEFGQASEPQGGYNEVGGFPKGTFDFSSDEIPIDAKPTLGVTSAGFINVYKIGLNELQNLGEVLFPHFLPAEILADPSTLSIPEMLSMFLKMAYGTLASPIGTTIELSDNLGILDIIMNGKLIDYVLDCHVIPTSISGATISPLKIGYRTFNDFQLAKATEDYVDIDCGTLNLKEVFANFLDYTCKCEIYLPFVGFVPLAPEYWNNASLQVHYRFNIIDGSFQVRLVTTRDNDGKECVLSNTVIAQYGGVCCVHFPITGLQYSNVVAGLVNGTASAVSNGLGGNYAGIATNLSNMAMLRPENPMSNGYNASSSFLGQKTPYLVIKRPAPQFSENYMNETGLPLNVYYPLSSISGFTVIDNPVLNIQCSDEEYNELVNLLKSGVIF